MDDEDVLLYCLMDQDSDSDSEDEETQMLSNVILTGILHGRAMHTALRNHHRLYLVRADLPADPRTMTSWQTLLRAQNDRAFITTMGVNLETFNAILESGFAWRWDSQTISRTDVAADGRPRLGRRCLDAAGALGLILHWLNSTMREVSLQQIFGLTPATTNRYLHHSLEYLLLTLEAMPEGRVCWPRGNEFEQYSDLITARHPLLVGGFGFVDGLNLPVQVSEDEEIENATYNGWLHDHFISNVLTFAPTGALIFTRLNAPGSWHDARVARKLYDKLLKKTPEGYFLIADTAFPRTATSIRSRIKTPLKSDARLPQDSAKKKERLRFNRQLVSCRQAAEWGMREIQGSFGRLRIPLPISDIDLRFNILEVVSRLHQVRVRMVGISQIRNVFEPLWQDGDELTEVWYNWQNMLFKDIRKVDRVSRFHHVEDRC